MFTRLSGTESAPYFMEFVPNSYRRLLYGRYEHFNALTNAAKQPNRETGAATIEWHIMQDMGVFMSAQHSPVYCPRFELT